MISIIIGGHDTEFGAQRLGFATALPRPHSLLTRGRGTGEDPVLANNRHRLPRNHESLA